ncbi:MAG: hypothetical protein WC256_13295 [Desulfurivibrionaceae bacterium]|jgi:predicted tellurium resistance membrane protein TerC
MGDALARLALVARIGMVAALLSLVTLTNRVLLVFSVRDLILISGVLSLLFKVEKKEGAGHAF